jgi:hypothetical protein
MKRIIIVLAAALAVFAVGYFVGARTSRPPAAISRTAGGAAADTAAPARMPADVASLKNQLAICMAYRAPQQHDGMTAALSACRNELEVWKSHPKDTLSSCHAFADTVPTYDRELGEADPSPETLERAQHLTIDDCGRVIKYAGGAASQQRTCLDGGKIPPGWKDHYGAPIWERALPKACKAAFSRDVLANALWRFEEQRQRETGAEPFYRMRMLPDGGLITGPVDEIEE